MWRPTQDQYLNLAVFQRVWEKQQVPAMNKWSKTWELCHSSQQKKEPGGNAQSNDRTILEHHFNRALALFWKDDERVSKALKYRCKEKHAKLYTNNRSLAMISEWMWGLMHQYGSNKPKSINGFLTKFPPKHKFFASTIVDQGWTYLTITVNVVGFVEAHSTLFAFPGLELTETTKEHHGRLDQRRELRNKRKLSWKYKQKKRNEHKYKKISEGNAKLAKDKAKGIYKTRMAGPCGSLKESEQPKQRAKSTHVTCWQPDILNGNIISVDTFFASNLKKRTAGVVYIGTSLPDLA
jgi:hypothetical protein